MLSFHLSILIFIVFEAAAVPLAIWIRLIYVRSSERKLGAGSSCRVRVADFAGLSMIFVTTCVMAIAACILSTKRQDPAWAVALELSACISLIVAEATYTTLILNFATPYLMFGAFFCVLMNSVLSFLPPALDLAGDMNISKLHVYSLSLDLFLAFIMCVFQALLLLGRALSGHGRASGPQWTKRALILFFVVATAEGIAFLVLAIDNIAYKRIPEEVLPWLFGAVSLLNLRFFPFKSIYRVRCRDSNDSQSREVISTCTSKIANGHITSIWDLQSKDGFEKMDFPQLTYYIRKGQEV